MHIPPATNKYQNIINKFKNNKDYKVLEDRNGWIALYKGLKKEDKSGKDELVRRIVQSDGSEKIFFTEKICEGLKKLFSK